MRSLVILLGILLSAGVAAGQSSRWTQVDPGSPDGRQTHALAYDTARGRTVLFGGVSGPLATGTPLGDTWEWDGQKWAAVATGDPSVTTHPSPRSGVAMTYDPKRQRVVLFGGKDAPGNTLADTWEWDGKTWTRANTGGPPARSLHALAFDGAAQQVMLFGGVDGGGAYLGDTWRWTGTVWQQLAVVGPPARQGPALASDATRKVVVLYGGLGTGGTGVTAFGDTWEWNGTSWSNKTPGSGPGPLYAASLVYDSTGRRTLLFGGLDSSFFVHAETWSWQGTSWTKLASFGPAARFQSAADYDAARRQVVLFGGGDSASRALADTWEFDGTLWQRRNFRSPGPRIGFGAAFDEVEQSTLVFGGTGYAGLLGDTWAWNGTGWARLATTGPAARSDLGMAYDELSGRVVLFGGAGASALNDTWEWDGGWTQRCVVGACPLGLPTRRSGAALAFDVNRHKIILFGGENAGVPAGDTWEWDTVADRWTQIATTGPSARSQHGLATDRARHRAVLFGGRAANGAPLGDTWEWDGTSWTQIPTAQAPAPRSRHGFVYDRVRDRVVLYGGIDGNGKSLLDMWEWNGAAWVLVSWKDPIPRERFGHRLSYDHLRRRLVLTAGAGPIGFVADTWENISLGAPCQKAADCHSGFCVDGVCCENACDGACRRCDLDPPRAPWFEDATSGPEGLSQISRFHDGICRQIPEGQPDPEGCPGETYDSFTCRGTCNAAGRCSGDFLEERCGVCRYCNPLDGRCDRDPPGLKDEECTQEAHCGVLSNVCRTYREYQGAGRCLFVGLCAGDAFGYPQLDQACTDYTDLDGAECQDGTAVCCKGLCRDRCACGKVRRPDGARCTDYPDGVCKEGVCVNPRGCAELRGDGDEIRAAHSYPLLLSAGLGIWLAVRALRRRSR